MPQLYIAKTGSKYPPTLPLDAVTRTFAVLGQRGTGKTNTAVVIVEEMVKCGAHVAVLDPVGAWWGITRAGRKRGLRGIVIGGEHGDVPLEETGGQLVADVVLSRAYPVVVVDLKLLRKGAQLRFMADYLEAVYHSNREALMQVFEEADRPLPQNLRSTADGIPAARTLGAGEDIVKLGRSRGLGALLVTQRPATLNKNVLEVCESLFLHRLMGPNDRKAVKGWVEANGDPVALKRVMDSMSSLGRGEAWLYAPWLGKGGTLERLRIRERNTFDSSFTPTVGAAPVDVSEAQRTPVDLDELRQRMAATVERAKAKDPEELKRRLAASRAEVERLAAENAELAGQREDAARKLFDTREERIGELAAALADVKNTLAGVLGVRDDLRRAMDLLDEDVDALRKTAALMEELRSGGTPATAVPEGAGPRRSDSTGEAVRRQAEAEAAMPGGHSPSSPPAAAESNGNMPGPWRRVLDALGWWEAAGRERVTRLQLAAVAGYHERTKSFTNALGAMNSEGLIHYPEPGSVALTAAGRAHAGVRGAMPTSDELQRAVFEQVGPARARILKAVLRHQYPVSRSALADELGYHERTKAFTNGLGSLRSLGWIEYPGRGEVKASDALFV